MPDLPREPIKYRLDDMLESKSVGHGQKVLALRVFLLIAMSIMFPFSIINYFKLHLVTLSLFEFSVGAVCLFLYYLITRIQNYSLVSKIFVILTGIVMLTILLALRTEESTLIWIGIFPIIAFYLLGLFHGTIAHLVFSSILLISILMGWNNGQFTPNISTLANVSGALFAFGVFIYFYEYTKNKALQLVFRHSFSDELTGTGNRKMFRRLLQKEKASSLRHLRPLSLIMVDIDHFKSVNDRFGHLSGDRVLVTFTELLRNNLRRSDLLFRWGGEEFIILLPDESLDRAGHLAEKLRKLIANHPFETLGRLTASFGVTEVYPGESDEETIHRLDSALYRAKDNGRNRVEKA